MTLLKRVLWGLRFVPGLGARACSCWAASPPKGRTKAPRAVAGEGMSDFAARWGYGSHDKQTQETSGSEWRGVVLSAPQPRLSPFWRAAVDGRQR
jgi:hypothetical protein